MHLLEAVPFREPARARDDLDAIQGKLDDRVTGQIQSLLAASPDPDRVLRHLAAFVARYPESFRDAAESSSGLQYLTTVFGYSRFLSEELLQHPGWLETVQDLERVRSAAEYSELLWRVLRNKPAGTADSLVYAQFRRRQILRILLCDVLGSCTLSETTEQLSNLADAILDVSLQRIRDEMIARHGVPRCFGTDGEIRECGFAVIALGKLGGMELNYSSDIDLMFVYAGNGETDGAAPVSNKEFYKKVANEYTALLSTYTAEGLCYRVDLRLRPDGSLGEICISLEGARKYYQTRARDWELQMLIKGRPCAGDRALGRELLDFTEPLTYSSSLDFTAVEAVSVTRMRIGEKLAARRGRKAAFDVKLAPGGIRDIEFLVQCLQRLHGGRVPWVRHAGTLLALSRLSDKDLLSEAEYGRLVSAYEFLRNLEHRLQFEDDRQTHSLPGSPADLELLARRMPALELGGEASADRLLQQLNAHLESVQEIYQRVIHAQQPMYYSAAPLPAPEPDNGADPALIEAASSNLVRYLDQRAPGLALLLARNPLRRGARAFEHFLEKVIAQPERLRRLDQNPVLARDLLDIFEHSAFYSEELLRTPELMELLSTFGQPDYDELSADLPDSTSLRRFFRREMFRTEAESMCRRVPVFSTLVRTSALADAVVDAAYRVAVHAVLNSQGPVSAGYSAEKQMMVIALGRLGMHEFDLSSDADLVFVLPDADAAESLFWTRVAERIIDILTAYTGEGTLLAVDTRLRPNGSAGALLQTEHGVLDYFERSAQAWEGIAYMKARAVAGDIEGSTTFLNRLQQVDWRRYGQSGRSRQALKQMRGRVEKEQGSDNPLKAGLGGYYDIDFVLMYLRLKGAGIFYRVLNTPERIDVVEQMGHLDRSDADFLRDAAIFYRAVDHGLRVYSGHAEGSLPVSPSHLECITELVHRWTPEHLNHQSLAAQLAAIRSRTRETFERLFV
ncbi:MAG TPA: glutamine-synthetase adenylyltransferase [Bryobacteraceae bacterium]|nr:glutamine-synthetase adenylyltransferase [Bryobacteraceae bacterium]